MADNPNAMISVDTANDILTRFFIPTPANPFYIGLALSETSVLNATTTDFKEPGNCTADNNYTDPTNNYARAKLTAMDTPKKGQTQNSDVIHFNETAGDGWGTVGYFGLFKSQSATAPFFWAKLTDANGDVTTKTIAGQDSEGNGYIPIFRAEMLKIAIDREPVAKSELED